MLFFLDDSLLPNLSPDSEKFEETIDAIEQLLNARRHGNLIVYASERLLSALYEGQLVSIQNQQLCKHLLLSHAQYGFISKLNSYIVVTNIEEPMKATNQSNQTEIKISPEIILKSRIIEQPIFLTENTAEKPLLLLIAKSIMFYYHFYLHLTFLESNGGGSTIWQPYEIYANENDRVFLVYTDSDKDYPKDTLHETASKLLKIRETIIKAGANIFLDEIIINNGREIENLLPTPILTEIIEDKQMNEFLAFLISIENTDKRTKLYIDHKLGFSFKNIVNSGTQELIDFWKPSVEQNLQNCHYFKGFDCFANGCQCRIHTGLGQHTLERANLIINKITPQKMLEAAKSNSELFNVWQEIGMKTISLLCTEEPYRS